MNRDLGPHPLNPGWWSGFPGPQPAWLGPGKGPQPRQDGRQSQKSKEELAKYRENLGLKRGRGYTAQLRHDQSARLNLREKDILDIHHQLIKAT